MTFTTTPHPGAELRHGRAPAVPAGLFLALALAGLARDIDIPPPYHDWQGKVATHGATD